MTIKDFIKELEDALQGELPTNEIRSNIEYYENYLYVKAKTSDEESAVAALGNPNLIAKSLINNYKMTHPNETSYNKKESYGRNNTSDTYNNYQSYSNTREGDTGNYDDKRGDNKKSFKVNSGMLKALVVIVPIILIILFFFISRLIFRFFIPIALIAIIVYVIKGVIKK